MATRLYLSSTAATFTPQLPAYSDSNDAAYREATRTKGVSAFATYQSIMSNAPVNATFLIGVFRWRLGAQTINGTVRGVARMAELYTLGTYKARCRLTVQSSDFSTVRGELVAATEGDTLSTGNVMRNTRLFNGTTVTPVTAQNGDWLVLELGATIPEGYEASTRYVYAEAGEAGADLTFDGTSTVQGAPWVEFSQTLITMGESPIVVGTVGTLREPFTGTGALPATFQPFGAPTTADVLSDKLRIVSKSSGNSGVESSDLYTLADSACTFKVDLSTPANLYLGMYVSGNVMPGFWWRATDVIATIQSAPDPATVGIYSNGPRLPWLRIRHESVGSMYYWDASADGQNWITFNSRSDAGYGLTNARVFVLAASSMANGSVVLVDQIGAPIYSSASMSVTARRIIPVVPNLNPRLPLAR